MTREIKVRTQQESLSDDCVLPPDDPIWALKTMANSEQDVTQALAAHASQQILQNWEQKQQSEEMKYAKKYNIKPGSPAWHALWNK